MTSYTEHLADIPPVWPSARAFRPFGRRAGVVFQSGWDLLVEPVEDASPRIPEAAGSPCESAPSASMNATIAFVPASLFLGLSRPGLLVLRAGDQDRAGDLGDQLVGKHVVAEGESFT